MRMMSTLVLGLALALTSPTGVNVAAQSQPPTPTPVASFAGTWDIAAMTTQGEAALQLILTQEDDTLEGTLATPHGDLAIEGRATDEGLQLHGVEENSKLTIVAKLGTDGTLSGSLTSEMGDATFKGKRARTAR